MGKGVAAVVVAPTVAASAGCSGGGDDQASRPPDTPEAMGAALGCYDLDEYRPRYENLPGEVVVDCLVDHRWPARLHAGPTAEERPALLRLLSAGGGIPDEGSREACRNGAPRHHAVAAGDDWVVVVSEADGLEEVVRLVGGEAVSEGRGPPASYPMVDCTRTPR